MKRKADDRDAVGEARGQENAGIVVSQPLLLKKNVSSTTTTKVQDMNMIRFMYDQIESKLPHHCRRSKDAIYCFVASDQYEYKKRFLDPLIGVLMSTYSPQSLVSDKNPDGLGGFGEKEYKILRRIVDDPKHTFAQNGLFFLAFYLLPSFTRFFINGNPEKGEPPPPVANRERLDHFIRKTLREKCEDLFNGRIGGKDAVYIFVETLLSQYITECGVPI